MRRENVDVDGWCTREERFRRGLLAHLNQVHSLAKNTVNQDYGNHLLQNTHQRTGACKCRCINRFTSNNADKPRNIMMADNCSNFSAPAEADEHRSP
jgi:hypothetical protein